MGKQGLEATSGKLMSWRRTKNKKERKEAKLQAGSLKFLCPAAGVEPAAEVRVAESGLVPERRDLPVPASGMAANTSSRVRGLSTSIETIGILRKDRCDSFPGPLNCQWLPKRSVLRYSEQLVTHSAARDQDQDRKLIGQSSRPAHRIRR